MSGITLGRIVRLSRRQKDLNLDAVAAKCAMSPSHLSRLERGELKRPIEYDVLLRLAESLSIPIGELVKANEEGEPTTQSILALPPTPRWNFDLQIAEVVEGFDSGDLTPEVRPKAEAALSNIGAAIFGLKRLLDSPASKIDIETEIALLRMAKSFLVAAKSLVVACVEARLGAALINAGTRTVTIREEKDDSLPDLFRSLQEAVKELRSACARFKSDPPQSVFECHMQVDAIANLAYVNGLIAKTVLKTENDLTVASIVGLLPFDAAKSEADRPIPEHVRLADLPVQTCSMTTLLRLSVALTMASAAIQGYLEATEVSDQQFNRFRQEAHLFWPDRCELATWQVHASNLRRNRLQLTLELEPLLDRFDQKPHFSASAQQGSFSEIESEMRQIIESFRELVLVVDGDNRTDGVRCLAWMHIEFGVLIRMQRDNERLRQSMWNHIIAFTLDSRRLPDQDRHSAILVRILRAGLDQGVAAVLETELEKKRQGTDFNKLDYEF